MRYYLTKPLNLYQLFSSLEKLSEKEQQNQLPLMLSSLANNNKKPTLKEVDSFIEATESHKELYKHAENCFTAHPILIFDNLLPGMKST